VSVAWHAAAAVLLFAALRLATGGLWRSFVVAALFVVHPAERAGGGLAAERSMVLGGFFFALTLLLWAGYVRRPAWGATSRRSGPRARLTAKPVLVTVPFVLLLLDAWPLCRLSVNGLPPWVPGAGRLRRAVLEKIPFFAVAAVSCLVTLAVQRQGGAVQSLATVPLRARLGNAPVAYWLYLKKIFWPTDLAILYPHPGTSLPAGRAVIAGLLLAAVTAALFAAARRKPWLAAGWLWFTGTLVPMIGLVQVADQALADRYAYLPAIGVFLLLVWLAADVAAEARHRGLLLGAAAGAAILALVP